MLESFDGVKVGDKLRCVKEHSNISWIKAGDVIEVTGLCYGANDKVGVESGYSYISAIDANCFELVKEKDAVKFDMKTQPWFIHVESEEQFKAVDDWLLVNFGQRVGLASYCGARFLTNASTSGTVYDGVLYGWYAGDICADCKEIKLSFKTTVDLVSLPEAETPDQAEIKRLTKIIEDAQESLTKLSNP